jgi:hypothetical protein
MASRLAEVLIRRVAAVGDPKTRVALMRSVLPTLDGGELRRAYQAIMERAGMRESSAQVTLLAIAEAMGGESSEAQSSPAASDRVERADWGTGRTLTLGERKSLARRPDRKLLDRALRDGHPDVVAQLLLNPRLTESDVARMCAARDARPEALATVFASPKWAIRPRVRKAIASNPRAPLPVALALIPLLGRGELREVAADERMHAKIRGRALEILRRLPPTPEVETEPQ